MQKTVDQKIDDLAIAVKAGFDSVDERFTKIDERFTKIDERFTKIETKLTSTESNVASIKATMTTLPNKDFLTEKLADVKGDLVVKLRQEDKKPNSLIELLRVRSILSDIDAQRLRQEFEIFPGTASSL